MQLESGSTRYGPGDSFMEPEGVLHSALVTSAQPLKALIYRVSPAGQPPSVFPVVAPHPWTIK